MQNRGIGLRLRMLNNAVRRYIDRNSEGKKLLDNISCSAGWIVGHVCAMEDMGRELYQRDFESEFKITRSTASKVLGLLEKKGLIERVTVSHDARLKKIVPTEKSREIGRIIRKDNEQLEAQLKKGFSQEELSQLYGYFERLMQNLGEVKEVKDMKEKGDNL